MTTPRRSGILLHPSSLPGRYGIGDLGEWAFRFVDYLVETEQSYWQVLPLGPTSYGDSPYQSPSTFAGNPNLISLDKLVEDGYLTDADLNDVPDFPVYHVDYGWVIDYHNKKLHVAYKNFNAKASYTDRVDFAYYCANHRDWLNDYALFMAIKQANNGKPWTEWSNPDLIRYKIGAIAQARTQYADDVRYYQFTQWLFSKQWTALREYANKNKIELIGDIPIFVAHDSSDVWGNQGLFFLNEDGTPTVIAGVPPDYFSVTGQRWGNPLYRWSIMKNNQYEWWLRRLRAIFELVDMVRIDHYRGFDAYWEIAASELTAVKGRWVKGPGSDFLKAVRSEFGENLPIIAEDLGVITPEVEALRDDFNLPGMQVLQFAFDGECGSNTFLPHHYPQNTIVYTGTHDNNTTFGWWHSDEAHEGIRACVSDYTGVPLDHLNNNIHWELIRLAMASIGHTCIIPMQDVLGYGEDTRMNTPGTQGNNWDWRMDAETFNNPAKMGLAHFTRLYTRHRNAQKERVNY